MKTRKKIRLQSWDYRNQGIYFITILTKDRFHYFGEIQDGMSILSRQGKIAAECWFGLSGHFNGLTFHEFVVMPNHIHALLEMDGNCHSKISAVDVRSGHDPTLQSAGDEQVKRASLSTIIGCYKSAVSKLIRREGLHFEWHRSFYDVIVRTEDAFLKISNYIQQNPQSWEKDKFH